MVPPRLGQATSSDDRDSDQPLDIFVIAGEASGDALGGALMTSLEALTTEPVQFRGVGGPAMTARGLRSLFDYSELSVMGLIEILPHAPRLIRRIRQVAQTINADPPDILITIDSPAFAFRVIRRLKGHAFPRVHYVAPTVWAWRPGRVYKFRRHFDHLLAFLPFEPPHFEDVGLPCTFVGHPVVETADYDHTDQRLFRHRHDISTDALLMCVLPGSRSGELDRHIIPFGDTVRLLAAKHPDLHIVIPTLPNLESRIRAETASWPVPVAVAIDQEERAQAMAASDIALAASGTVTLELARARTPTIVAYRVAPVTAWIASRLIRVRFAAMVNIIAGREVIPEFLQRRVRSDAMAAAIESLLAAPEKRQQMQSAQGAAMKALGEGGKPPSRRAAAAVLEVLRDWRKTHSTASTNRWASNKRIEP